VLAVQTTQLASQRSSCNTCHRTATLPPPKNQHQRHATQQQVQEEGHRVALFHRQQEEHWAALAGSIDSYVDSVKELAEHMAVAGERRHAAGRLGGGGAVVSGGAARPASRG
jgi:hypothetical protein